MNIKHFTTQNGGEFKIYDSGNAIGSLLYTWDRVGNIYANDTHVSASYRGENLGLQLLDALFKFAAENKVKVVPVCSYVAHQFRKHPEFKVFLAANTK